MIDGTNKTAVLAAERQVLTFYSFARSVSLELYYIIVHPCVKRDTALALDQPIQTAGSNCFE